MTFSKPLTLFFLGSAINASSAIITWGPATNATADTDVSLNGTLVEAVNAAATSVNTDPVINGVTFDSRSLLSNNTDTDVFSGNISVNYNQLLSNVDFGGGTSPTLSLGGGQLIPGQNYEIQVWYAETRNNLNTRVMRFTDNQGGAPINLGNGTAQFAIGTFTADGINQNLQLLPQGFSQAHINAYQIRALNMDGQLGGFFSQAVNLGNNTFEVTLYFSVNVTGLLESEINVSDGTLVNGSLSGSGNTYRFRLTSTNSTGFTVSLPADAVEDNDGDMNIPISRTFTPSDIISGPIPTLIHSLKTVSAPYLVTVHFDQAISGLSLSDFTITNGTLSGFIDHTLLHSDNIANYSLTVTPTSEGAVILSLPNSSVTSDTTGVGNVVSNTLVTQYELSPRVEINGSKTSSRREFEVFFSFTPQINGFESSDTVSYTHLTLPTICSV